jgi:cytochrome c oxidase cbb3-type subunit I/II
MWGTPYPEFTEEEIQDSVTKQSTEIAESLREAGVIIAPEKEIVALISYLQKLGKSEGVASGTLEEDQPE